MAAVVFVSSDYVVNVHCLLLLSLCVMVLVVLWCDIIVCVFVVIRQRGLVALFQL